MLKLLLLDADSENIKNFKNYLKIYFPIVKPIYTLSDTSINVLDAVKEVLPQLIVSDIRFFGNAPLKVMRDISEMYPDTRFIVYGTFNDSEYIKKAREYGVIDYMYRPVKPADFRVCMEKAIAFFEQFHEQKRKEEQVKEKYKNDIDLFEVKFLETLMKGCLHNDSEINRSISYFHLDLDEIYTVFIIRIDHFNKIILTLEEMDKHLLIYKICNLAKDKLSGLKIKGKAFIHNFNFVTCLVSGKLELETLYTICEEIKNDIFNSMKIRVTIGIGRSYEKLSDIFVSYNEADAAIRYRFYIGYNSVIPIHFVDATNTITYRYPTTKEERLVYTSVIGEYEHCVALLSEIFESLELSGQLPEKLLPKIIMNILISISRYASEQNIVVDNEFKNYFSTSEALNLKSLDEAHEYLKNALKNFCGYMMQLREEKNSNILNRVKAIINEKYYETNSISKMAIQFNTTAEYLNRLFVETENKTYFEYLVSTRMEVAKRLIVDTALDDDVIAINVGYDDVRHFRGVFKQYTHQTLNEYRSNNRKFTYK